jgi:hypothetical protein
LRRPPAPGLASGKGAGEAAAGAMTVLGSGSLASATAHNALAAPIFAATAAGARHWTGDTK